MAIAFPLLPEAHLSGASMSLSCGTDFAGS
jgi:hypothetical protein